MNPDTINAGFEALAVLATLLHCRALWRAKRAMGVSVVSTLFFSVWGWWALFYLASLGQWASMGGAVGMAAANACYVALLFKFRRAGEPAI